MSLSKSTEGGWIWWMTQIRQNKPELLEELGLDALMHLYINGVKWEDAA